MELLGEVRDRSVCTPESLQDAASRGVRERGERGIEVGSRMLNHAVQFLAHGLAAFKGSRPLCIAARSCDATSLHVLVDADGAKDIRSLSDPLIGELVVDGTRW